ncbi:MAG: single-stranded DNA-binding protein, partial [Acutalibacteraceae bacterium]
ETPPPTDFLNVTAWRQTAEFITRYFRKASSICVVGSIQTRSWTDKDGQKRFATEIVADEAYFVDAKSDNHPQIEGQAHAGNAVSPQPTYIPEAYTQTPNFGEINDGEELPF